MKLVETLMNAKIAMFPNIKIRIFKYIFESNTKNHYEKMINCVSLYSQNFLAMFKLSL